MTKQEKIQEAYGKYYPQLKDYIDENGWSSNWNNFASVETILFEKEDIEKSQGKWRLKFLQGIESNNGWIKIESKDDLPKYGYYEVILRGNNNHSRASLCRDFNEKSQLIHYSHYQPIIKPQPPIY